MRESRHYSAQQQSLDKQLRECVYNIRNKEDLISALKRNDLQAKQLSQQYLVRVLFCYLGCLPENCSCNPTTLCLGQLVKPSHVVLTHSHVVLTHRLCSSQCALLLYHIKSGRLLLYKKMTHFALSCPKSNLEGKAKFFAGLVANPMGRTACKSWKGRWHLREKSMSVAFHCESNGQTCVLCFRSVYRSWKGRWQSKVNNAYYLPFGMISMGRLVPCVSGAPTRAGRADGSQGKGAPEAEGRARGHRQ